MKRFFSLGLFSLVVCSALADAGFSIRRKHELTVLSFSGIGNLDGYKLIQTHVGFYVREGDTRPYAKMGQIIEDDNFTINVQEGGRRWDESDRNIYLNLVEPVSGITVDSFHFYAKDYSMHFKISGVKDGKLQYRTDSTRSSYQYLILNEDDEATAESYRRNRLIFIACSALGFILLAWLFVKRKNMAVQPTKNS
ncbi:MAG TPA: hypothetical protein VK622_15800 [Puia sp.]|nr:hypothetical protein [Puia sp.]